MADQLGPDHGDGQGHRLRRRGCPGRRWLPGGEPGRDSADPRQRGGARDRNGRDRGHAALGTEPRSARRRGPRSTRVPGLAAPARRTGQTVARRGQAPDRQVLRCPGGTRLQPARAAHEARQGSAPGGHQGDPVLEPAARGALGVCAGRVRGPRCLCPPQGRRLAGGSSTPRPFHICASTPTMRA